MLNDDRLTMSDEGLNDMKKIKYMA